MAFMRHDATCRAAFVALAALSWKFPACREFSREFPRKRPSGAIIVRNFPSVFRGLHAEFPTRRSREFSIGEQGIFRPIKDARAEPRRDEMRAARGLRKVSSRGRRRHGEAVTDEGESRLGELAIRPCRRPKDHQ
jgi:hypothetical protein